MAKLNVGIGQSSRTLKITRRGDEVSIVRDHRSGCAALFLGVWLTGWTAGCCALTWELLFGRGNLPWLFPIPFYLGEIAGIVGFIATLTHKEYVRLDRDGFEYFRWAVRRWGYHRIPIDELESFVLTVHNLDGDGDRVDVKNDVERATAGYGAIHAEGVGMPFPFFNAVTAGDAKQATDDLNEVLTVLRATVPTSSPSAPPRQPAGSAWQQVNEDDCVRLDRASRSTLGSVLGVLGFALFWNSIVGVFTGIELGLIPVDKGGPKGFERWFLVLFLIPFQLIGAFLAYALASSVWEWLAIESWRLYRGRMVRSKSLLGLRVSTTAYDNIDCLRLDCLPETEEDKLDNKPEEAKTKQAEPQEVTAAAQTAPGADALPPFKPDEDHAKPPMTIFPDGQPIEVDSAEDGSVAVPEPETWKLVFVKRDETPLIEWKGLSFGEARWLGSIVLRERPEWFHERG